MNNSNCKKINSSELKVDTLSSHLKQLCYSIGLLKPTKGPGYTLESLCLHFHYRFLVFFFFVCYLIVALKWHTGEQISCVVQSQSEVNMKDTHKNICLSYSFVEQNGHRRYLLFYRWASPTFLLTAVFMYCLRCVFVKNWEDPRLAKLWKDVWDDRQNYEPEHWRNNSKRVLQYLVTGQASYLHYYKLIVCHLLANVVDLAVICFLEFALQGNFVNLVPKVIYNLKRDPENFTDPLSLTFPPFAKCQINEIHEVMEGRETNYGCHLVLMEVYEKIFVMAWIVLAVHWLWSMFMLFWLCLRVLPFIGKFIFVITEGMFYKQPSKLMLQTIKVCKLEEIYVLYLMSKWMSYSQLFLVIKSFVMMKKMKSLKKIWNSSPDSEAEDNCKIILLIENYYSKSVTNNVNSAIKSCGKENSKVNDTNLKFRNWNNKERNANDVAELSTCV